MKPLSSDFLHENHTDGGPATLADVDASIVGCERCPRLRAYCVQVARERKRAHQHDTYWGRPVPGFGDPRARLLLVGLAPAAHGANRTGRVFTGDGPGGSADFLMAALHRAGLANKSVSFDRTDGLALQDTYISMAVRCAPPGNRPSPEEIRRCLPHLLNETAMLTHVRVVVALGRVAFDAWLRVYRARGVRMARKPLFEHGGDVVPGGALPTLIGCYHPSRQNTNTGRLTASMLDEIIARATRLARD